MFLPGPSWIAELVALICLIIAAVTDIQERIIPNTMVLAVMGAGVMFQLLTVPGQIGWAMIVYAVTLIALGLLARQALVGWGDVKMIAAVTLLAPPGEVMEMLAAIAIAGGVLACVYLGMGRVLAGRVPAAALPAKTGLAGVVGRERARILTHEPMPYGVAVLGGVLYFIAIKAIQCWPATYCS